MLERRKLYRGQEVEGEYHRADQGRFDGYNVILLLDLIDTEQDLLINDLNVEIR